MLDIINLLMGAHKILDKVVLPNVVSECHQVSHCIQETPGQRNMLNGTITNIQSGKLRMWESVQNQQSSFFNK